MDHHKSSPADKRDGEGKTKHVEEGRGGYSGTVETQSAKKSCQFILVGSVLGGYFISVI